MNLNNTHHITRWLGVGLLFLLATTLVSGQKNILGEEITGSAVNIKDVQNKYDLQAVEVVDEGEKLDPIEVELIKENYGEDKFFKTLISNTNICLTHCEATFLITNPFAYPIPVDAMGFLYFGRDDGKKSVSNEEMRVEQTLYRDATKIDEEPYNKCLKDYCNPEDNKTYSSCESECVTDNTVTYKVEYTDFVKLKESGVREIPARGSLKVRVSGDKQLNQDIDWIPYVALTKEDYANLPSDGLNVAQTKWAWWSSSWTRRKTVTIAQSPRSDPTNVNYPVKVAVTYDADGQADFDDIRFTDTSNNELFFCRWNKTDSTQAVYFVNKTLSGAATTDIYMYYGNAGAGRGGNCNKTFDAWDDFETGSVPNGKWTDHLLNSTVTGGYLNLRKSSWAGSGMTSILTNNLQWNYNIDPRNRSIFVRWFGNIGGGDDFVFTGFRCNIDGNGSTVRMNPSGSRAWDVETILNSGGASSTTDCCNTQLSDDTYYNFQFSQNTSVRYDVRVNNVFKSTNTLAGFSCYVAQTGIGLWNDPEWRVDDWRVAKSMYPYTEPAVSFGAEVGADGTACSDAGTCSSGYCVDSVCCNNACSSTCTACDVAGSVGTCQNIPDNTDPDIECTAGANCYTGDCNGAGACKTYTDGGKHGCSTCLYCSSGASACQTVPNNQDPNADCGITQCDNGAVTPYYFGWTGTICSYRLDEPASTSYCDGSSACQSAATLCPDNGRDGDTVTCDCALAEIGCTATTAGSCNNALCPYAPEARNVDILPAYPSGADNLQCYYEYYDRNADVENTAKRLIRWYKNGVIDTDWNNQTIVNNLATTDGETWKCNVSVSDGTLSSNWTASPIYTLGGVTVSSRTPASGFSQTHRTKFKFTALLSASVGSTVYNSTLHLWNSTALYKQYKNSTTGSSVLYESFGNHTLPTDNYRWALKSCTNLGICTWTDNYTLASTNSNPVVSIISPANDSVVETVPTFYCHVSDVGDTLSNTTITLTNLTAPYVSAVSVVTGVGYKTFAGLSLPNTQYTWRCKVCDMDNDCSFSGTYNLIKTTLTTTTSDTGGACMTPYGLVYRYTAGASDDLTMLNLTTLYNEGYLIDTKASNVLLDGATGYYHHPNHLIVDSSAPANKIFNVYISGYTYNHTKATVGNTPDKTVSLQGANFTASGNAYLIDFRREEDNQIYYFKRGSNRTNSKEELRFLCINYAPDTLNLTNYNLAGRPIFITLKEKPVIELYVKNRAKQYLTIANPSSNTTTKQIIGNGTVNNTYTYWNYNLKSDGFVNITNPAFHEQYRRYQPYLQAQTIPIYIASNKTTLVKTLFQMDDYTGDAGNSFLSIIRNVNNSLSTIWQEQFYNVRVPNVYLANNTYYQFVVFNLATGSTRVIGWNLINSNDTTKTIIIQQPFFNTPTNWTTGINAGFTGSYSTGVVEFDYIVNTSVATLSSAQMIVYQKNGSGHYNLLYNTTVLGGQSGSITYTVPDKNSTYRLKGLIVTNIGSGGAQQDMNLYTIYGLDLFYPKMLYDLPDMILGVSKDKVYTSIAMFVLTAAAMAFGGASAGTGGLVFVALLGVTKYLGWFREMTWTIFFLLLTGAIIYKVVEGRAKWT